MTEAKITEAKMSLIRMQAEHIYQKIKLLDDLMPVTKKDRSVLANMETQLEAISAREAQKVLVKELNYEVRELADQICVLDMALATAQFKSEMNETLEDE